MTTTSTTSRPSPTRRASFSTANKIGLVLAGLLGAADCTSLISPTPPGEVGPPMAILVVDTILGVVTLVAVVLAWRTLSRGLVRLAAGARILSMVTALPAFFAGVPAFLVAIVSVFVLLTVAAVVLMLLPARRPLEA